MQEKEYVGFWAFTKLKRDLEALAPKLGFTTLTGLIVNILCTFVRNNKK